MLDTPGVVFVVNFDILPLLLVPPRLILFTRQLVNSATLLLACRLQQKIRHYSMKFNECIRMAVVRIIFPLFLRN